MNNPRLKYIADTLLHSYSSIFFSQTHLLGLILLVLSFFNVVAGIYGLLSVGLVNLFSHLLQLNRFKIQSGYYGFNAVLSGIAIGSIFSFSPFSLFMLFASSMLIVFLSVFIEGVFQKYQLPYVSIPFLIALWCIQLSANCTDDFLGYGITSVHESQFKLTSYLTNNIEVFQEKLPAILKSFFLSISSIFFQKNVLFGCIVAIGLFHFSRIGFTISLLNHIVAYYMFQLINGTMYNTPYELLGFNFIFTSLAVGCYYIIPSSKSVLWSLLLIPLQYLLIFSSSRFLNYFYLPTYSLAFCATTLLFLYFIKQQKSSLNPEIASYIEKTPEKTKYNSIVNKERLKFLYYQPIGLPFWGIWKVAQGHNGEYTHKSNWQHAWDFIIEDKDGKQYNNDGYLLEDYYCYSKPVISPIDAIVVGIENDVEDNEPGKDNKIQNWGNYVILKMVSGLYIVICHLQQGSVCVSLNQSMQKGQRIANCGNSGHSPFPHIHMQIQYSPIIGAPTAYYPLSDIQQVNKEGYLYHKCYVPKRNESVFNPAESKYFFNAFNLSSYRSLTVTDNNKSEKWELLIDIYGLTYISDENSNCAWFSINKSNFYFYRYEGKKDSNLYLFYLSNYNVQLTTSTQWLVKDYISLSSIGKGLFLFLQDLLAPVKIFYSVNYINEYFPNENYDSVSYMIHSKVSSSIFNRRKELYSFETTILEEKIDTIKIKFSAGHSKILKIEGERYE